MTAKQALRTNIPVCPRTVLSEEHAKTGRSPKAGPEGYLDLGDGASITYLPKMFSNADALFHQLREELIWERRKICIYGKEVYQPRLISYMADDSSLCYTYSRSTLAPYEYTPTVLTIKEELEALLNFKFNCVLCNLYRDGGDGMGWHADNEQLFGKCPVIGSVSFGYPRAFDIRKDIEQKYTSNSKNNNINNNNNSNDTMPIYHLRYMIGEGDVVVMQGTMQESWKHAVITSKSPKQQTQIGPRINLTFRKIVFPENEQKKQGTF